MQKALVDHGDLESVERGPVGICAFQIREDQQHDFIIVRHHPLANLDWRLLFLLLYNFYFWLLRWGFDEARPRPFPLHIFGHRGLLVSEVLW